VRTRSVDLAVVSVDVGDGRSAQALDLVDSWASHVLRFCKESSTTSNDSDLAWGVHDWVAALYIRDRVQHAVDSQLNDAQLPATVQVADELFRSFTTLDDDNRLRLAASDLPREPWWWARIPVGGPVATELSQIVARRRAEA